jgi:hypothetical protein
MGGRITSESYSVYRGWIVLGRFILTQQSHLSQRPMRLTRCYWKVERYRLQGTDLIPAELIQAGEETLHSDTCKAY